MTIEAMEKHAVVLAGGRGTRLRPFTTTIPKPLVPIGGEYSILEIVMRQLAQQGFIRATLAIGHLGQLIRAYVGDGEQWDIEIAYVQEDAPLGTIGPVLGVLDTLPDNFLVINGDILTNLPFARLLAHHCTESAGLTIAAYRRQIGIEFGVLQARDDVVVAFEEKPTLDLLVSMGAYAIQRDALDRYRVGEPLGFDELVIDMLREGTNPMIYEFDGYWLDVGRPEDYDQANAEFDSVRDDLLR